MHELNQKPTEKHVVLSGKLQYATLFLVLFGRHRSIETIFIHLVIINI